MTIFGWDMSHFDSPSIGNAVSQGISFFTHKAGGDSSTGDAELDDWWANVKDLPQSVVLGAYWVLRPDLMASAASEADNFLARLDAVCKGWRDRDAFILQLDAEEWNGNSVTKPSINQCNAFCDRLVARTSGRYTPVGYLPKWVYGSVSSFRYPVWASSYVSDAGAFKSLYPGDGSSRWNAYGKPVSILQYSSSATIGGQTTCDANAFRGSVADLKQLVTPGGESMSFIDTQDDFNKAMNTWAGTSAGALAICKAVMTTDNVLSAPNAATSDNKFWAPGTFLQNTYLAAVSGRDYAASDVATGKAIQADLADGVPANVDVAALATALDALLPDVTIDEQTVINAFRDMATAAQPPAAS